MSCQADTLTQFALTEIATAYSEYVKKRLHYVELVSGPDQAAARRPGLCKNRGMRSVVSALAFSLMFAAAQAHAAEGKTYKWTDESGVVHYGDHVPPRYAKSRTEVLNRQGVTVRVYEGEKTPEELLEEMRLRRLDDEKRAAEAARRAYDRALIDSYASVEEILHTRERRLNAVDGQIIFTTQNIKLLKSQIASLEAEIAQVVARQRTKGVKQPLVPKRFSDELEQSQQALVEHEAILEQQYLDQARIRIKYAEDIERYKLLRGIGEDKSESS